MAHMYEESIRAEFPHQTDVFSRAGALKQAATLESVLEAVPADPEARWLEVACGAGMIGRSEGAERRLALINMVFRWRRPS
jgi:hypothetical protein